MARRCLPTFFRHYLRPSCMLFFKKNSLKTLPDFHQANQITWSNSLLIQNLFHTSVSSLMQDNVELIISDIAQNAQDLTIGSLLYQKSSLAKIIDFMLSNGFSEKEICGTFKSQGQLLGNTYEELMNILNTFLESGFLASDICLILSKEPGIVNVPDNVQSIMLSFRELGILDKQSRRIVKETPSMLFETASSLSQRYAVLLSLFRKSDVQHMLRKSPDILMQSKEEISTKVDYIYHKMGLDQVEMVWADVLAHDIDYIRCRHLFLERAGSYEKPDRRGSTRQPNPYLKDIMGVSDKKFAEKLAGLSLKEYQVFQKIVKLEQEIKASEFGERFDSDDEEEPEGEETGYKAERVQKSRMRKQLLEYEQ